VIILLVVIVAYSVFVLIIMEELCGYFVLTCVWCCCVFSVSSGWGVSRQDTLNFLFIFLLLVL
jgi:hypothetical protein